MKLIINADDFGLSKSISDGIIEGIKEGYIDEYTKTVTSYLGREDELNILKKAKEQNIFDEVELISYKEL